MYSPGFNVTGRAYCTLMTTASTSTNDRRLSLNDDNLGKRLLETHIRQIYNNEKTLQVQFANHNRGVDAMLDGHTIDTKVNRWRIKNPPKSGDWSKTKCAQAMFEHWCPAKERIMVCYLLPHMTNGTTDPGKEEFRTRMQELLQTRYASRSGNLPSADCSDPNVLLKHCEVTIIAFDENCFDKTFQRFFKKSCFEEAQINGEQYLTYTNVSDDDWRRTNRCFASDLVKCRELFDRALRIASTPLPARILNSRVQTKDELRELLKRKINEIGTEATHALVDDVCDEILSETSKDRSK